MRIHAYSDELELRRTHIVETFNDWSHNITRSLQGEESHSLVRVLIEAKLESLEVMLPQEKVHALIDSMIAGSAPMLDAHV